MKLSLIVARHITSEVIGVDGELPWHCPQDLKLFKEITSGPNKAVVMGRNTWDSLPVRPLPGRLNIVVTTDGTKLKHFTKALSLEEVTSGKGNQGIAVAGSIQEAIVYAEENFIEELIFIGGKAIYDAVVDIVDEAYVSEMMMELSTGDKPVVRFEYEFTKDQWDERWTDVFDDGEGELLFTHYHFVRKK